MSIELQIEGAALAALTSRTVRQRLRSACLPPFSGFSIDHLEVVPGAASVQMVQSSVEVHVPADVFIVADAALFAAPNGIPVGATTPVARITLAFRLQITLSEFSTSSGESATRSVLTLVPARPDLGPLAAVPGVNVEDVAQRLQAVVPASAIDLTSQLKLLGVTSLKTADIVLVDGVVAVRFGVVAGAPRSALFPGQQWGLFVDAPAVEQLVRSKVEPSIAKKLPGADVSSHYNPSGTVPHVDLAVGLNLSISAFDVRTTVDLPCDFSLLIGTAPVLRATINWSVHVNTDLLPGFVESIAEGYVEDAIDPSQFGGTPIGDHVFVLDSTLPAIPLLGVLFRYDSVFGSPAGMTIGGAVVIPGLFEPLLTLSVSKLGRPTRIQLCSKLAKSGSGAPSKEPPTLQNTTSFGQVEISGCGAICAIERRTPGNSFQQYLASPAPGTVLEDATVRVKIPYDVADTMTQPYTFVVRTPRGVRFVDLGVAPKVRTDATGRVLDALDLYIPDCLTVVPLGDGRFGLGWGGGVDVFKPPPIEGPDWGVFLQQAGGLIVQLVRATGLDAGEFLRFRSGTHAIDVVADAQGRALVPVMLPLSAAVEPALLARADGRSLEGHVAVDSAVFESHLTLPGALQVMRGAGLATTRSGSALVATRTARKTLLHTVTSHGAVSRAASRDEEVELNPQPLPPVERGADLAALNPQPLPPVRAGDRTRELTERAGIRGVDRIVAVPGFASSGIAVAMMTDGTRLLLRVERSGSVRITGTFAGPIGAIEVAGGWAVADTGRDVAVFRVAGSTAPSSLAHYV